MRALPLSILVVLGLGCVVLATRVLDRFETGGWGRLEVGLERTARLTPETLDRLERLDADLNLTYFVSPPSAMPSEMRDVEAGVTDLLEALRAAAPDRVDFQIVDPGARDDLGSFTSRRRVAPFRVRTVERDAYSETTVYSSLAVSYGSRPEVAIHGIGPLHLARLQALLTQHLDELEQPSAIEIGLASPVGFEEFADLLAERGRVRRFDLDAGDPVPLDVDVLFWIRPETVYPETLAELDRFLERGKSLVIAGELAQLGPAGIREVDGRPALQLDRRETQWPELLAHLGLGVSAGLVLDERSDRIVALGDEHDAPFLVRCIAPNQDFQRWSQQPNGTQLFLAPSPIGIDPAKLASRRLSAHVLATTSDATRLGAAPFDAPLSLDAMVEYGEPTPKLPLVVSLEPDDPWAGQVVAFAATTPFENGALRRPGTAHVRLVDTLLSHLASSERLIASQADVARAEPLPPLSRASRVGWRLVCVFLVPLVLALGALRSFLRSGGFRLGHRLARSSRTLGFGLASLAAVLGLVALTRIAGAELDATADDLHDLPDAVVELFERELGQDDVRATLYVSSRSSLPPEWRPRVRRLTERLARFEKRGLLSDVTVRYPDQFDDNERSGLAALDVTPIDVTSEGESETIVRTLFASLVLESDNHRETISFRRLRGFDEPDFAIALALRSVARGARPRIAFASDVPRLSAAEAYENFQQQGLFAPLGSDVYSLARESLTDLGFDVVHVNPRDPELPDGVDSLVWMQPRRSVGPMLTEFVKHLVGGGRALLAAQHFVIQARQYRGADFEHVYWPQPQSNDLEHLYFPECGIRLEREVLFDERSTRIQHDTRVTGRSAGRDVEVQDSALPFLLRTASANSSPDSPITNRLGDQAFLWADSIALDEARLKQLGLAASPLITTSERSWSFPWKGGYLPPAILEGPEGDFRGRLNLAVRVDGTFPTPDRALGLDDREEPFEVPEDWPASASGSLVLVGCSQLFRNERLFDDEFRSRDLLINAIAALALEQPLAELAARRAVPRGFDYVAPRKRLRWRGIVLAAPILALLLAGGLLALVRRRPLKGDAAA